MSHLALALAMSSAIAGAPEGVAATETGQALVERLEIERDDRAVAVARLDSTALPQGAFAIRFRPAEALDAAWVERQFADNGMLGTPAPLDRIAVLVQEISLAFIRNGYVNSGLLLGPMRQSEDGKMVLHLRLISGRIAGEEGTDGVQVSWAGGKRRGLDAGYVIARMPAARVTPLDGNALERDFRSFAADPAIATVKADLLPGSVPGLARLSLLVTPAPQFEGYAGVANDRSPSVGAIRYGAGLAMRNVLSSGDRIAFDGGLTAGRPDLAFDYVTPFAAPRLALALRGSINRAAVVDAPLRDLAIRARDWSIEGGLVATLLSRPISPSPETGGRATSERTLVFGARYLHRETRTFLLSEPFSFSPGSVNGRAAYDAARFSLDFTDRSGQAAWLFGITATVGIDGTRSDVAGIPDPEKHFVTLVGQASHARRLGRGGFELRVRLKGQLSNGPVYSGERFSAGGSQSVRGFRENQLLADQGLLGSVELARPLRVGGGMKGLLGLEWGSLTASLFAEGAVVRNRDTDLQPDPSEIASIGAALAWTPSPRLTARISYGYALTDVPALGSTDLQDRGVSFAVTYRLAM